MGHFQLGYLISYCAKQVGTSILQLRKCRPIWIKCPPLNPLMENKGILSSNLLLFPRGHFSSVQSLNHVLLFGTPWTSARQASLSIANSQSLLKIMSIELVMPTNHLILCCPLLLLPSIFPSIRVFSNESALCKIWPNYCTFSMSLSKFQEIVKDKET